MKKILNNKIFKLVYGLIKFVFFFILILYVGFLVFQRVSNNSSIAGYRVFTIATGSMEPKYVVGDVILVHEEDYDKLKVGDDVTYLGEALDFKDKIVTHRIIEMNKEEKKLTTQGIANDVADPEIKASQLFGKVSYKFLTLSFVTKLLNNKVGFYFIIFVPLVLVIFLEVADLVTKHDEELETDDEDEREN